MHLKENLSIPEMKKLFNEIIKEEEKNYKINIKAFPITVLEFYKKEILKKGLILVKDKKYKLKRKIDCLKEKNNLDIRIIFGEIKQYCNEETLKKAFKLYQKVNYKLTMPLTTYGWFNPKTKQIFCILDKYKNVPLLRNCRLDFLIMTAYHEVRHRFQEQVMLKQNTYESFLMQIEYGIKSSTIISGPDGFIDYRIKHDRYMIEIDANNYSINKTIEYIKKYPEVYSKFKEKLEKRQKNYKQDLELYDPYSMFEKINKLIKDNSKEVLNKIQILNIFYNEDGEFKSLTEILKEKDKVDYRIIELVLSSNAFLKQLDLNSLSTLQQEYMLNLLNKVYSLEVDKQQKLQDSDTYDNLRDYLYNLKERLVSLSIKREFLKILNKKLEEFDNKNKKEQIETIVNILTEEQQTNPRTNR